MIAMHWIHRRRNNSSALQPLPFFILFVGQNQLQINSLDLVLILPLTCRYFLQDSNALSGPLPKTMGCLPNLMEIDLSDNKLEGTIPAEWGLLRK